MIISTFVELFLCHFDDYPVKNSHSYFLSLYSRNEKRTPLIRKRSQNINNYGFQDRTDARYRAIANLAKLIPDTVLLKQLLESELFNENDPEVQEQRMGRPELGYRTYPAIQQQTPNERFQPAYVHFTLFPNLILSMKVNIAL